MMDNIRQLMVSRRRSLRERILGEPRGSERRRRASLRWSANLEPLERRELLSTTQNFDTPGTAYSLPQNGGLPAATVQPGGPPNYLILATTPTTPVAGNDNSISFVTSDVGTYEQATASWDFRVTTQKGFSGVGMSFALLNTANYGTSSSSGGAFSSFPQQGLYNGSLAFGFDTTNDVVYLSMNAGIVTAASLPTLQPQLILASGQFITARASIDFIDAKVSLSLTPSGGSPVTVFSSTAVPGLAPYQSRVGLQAKNTAQTSAEFDLDNINVQYIGLRQPGTIKFGSANYVVNENQTTAQIDVVRPGGTAGSFLLTFTSADGTAQNGVNYRSVSGTLVFGEGVPTQTVVIPILDDHLYDGDKIVNLYLSNTVNFGSTTPVPAPLGSPIVAQLTIINTDQAPPTVSPKVQPVFAPHSRRVLAFRLTFSTTMDRDSAQNIQNYEILLPPARKNGPKRVVPISQATLDSSGLMVTLYRASLGQHLTKLLQILVRGKPPTGLIGTNGTFLAGTNGQSGTDAVFTVSL